MEVATGKIETGDKPRNGHLGDSAFFGAAPTLLGGTDAAITADIKHVKLGTDIAADIWEDETGTEELANGASLKEGHFPAQDTTMHDFGMMAGQPATAERTAPEQHSQNDE